MIEVKDLYFTYPHRTTATLRGLNFTIDRGEIFGFLARRARARARFRKS
jgi:energy-coupling factor transporter ATP-binding protein EcfA2